MFFYDPGVTDAQHVASAAPYLLSSRLATPPARVCQREQITPPGPRGVVEGGGLMSYVICMDLSFGPCAGNAFTRARGT